MWIEIWECQSIWALADILLTWIPCVIVFYLFHPYSWDNWGGYVLYSYWLIEMHHHSLYWNNIVHMHRDETEYKLGTWRSSVRKLFDIMIVRWDRPHRHVEIVRVGIWTSRVPHGSWTLDVFPRSIMYIRLSEYWVFWDISLHGIILHCISSHHSFLMTICFVWCLKNIKCWFPLLMKLK